MSFSAHRKKRLRRPLPGMLLFQDGSTHRWIATVGRDLDLILGSSPRTTLDDATAAIYSAFLVEQEGTMSSFLGLAETIGRHGLFGAFYTDRGGHYFITPKDAGKVDKTQLTPGRPRAVPARHHPYPVLFAAGALPHGTGVRHAAEAAAAGAAAGQDQPGRCTPCAARTTAPPPNDPR